MTDIMKTLYDIWTLFKSLTNDTRSAYLDNLQAFENHIKFILRWYRHKGYEDGEDPDYFTEDGKFFLINSNFRTRIIRLAGTCKIPYNYIEQMF